MTSLILKPSLLIKELQGEHDSLISLSVLESFLLAFEGGVPSTLKQGLSVVPKTPQVLSKPAHPPKLAPGNLLGKGWGRASESAFLPGVSDTTHWQVTLGETLLQGLGQRHKLHQRSFLVHLTLHHIPESSTHLGIYRHPSNTCHLTTADQRNQFSLTVKNNTMYLLK